MARPDHDRRALAPALVLITASVVLFSFLAGCSKPSAPAHTTADKATEQIMQQTFASPEEAGEAFLAAARAADTAALLAIFGADGKDVVLSGDPVMDKDNLREFVAAHEQMHRWREIKVGGQMLQIGADNFPFPIPLGKTSAGRWEFDTAAGKDEILARRIGHDELVAIAACAAIASAQQQYFSHTRDGGQIRQYAQKLVSDEGRHNGLFWPVAAGQPPSPLDGVRDFAKAAGYTSAGAAPQPFSGYYFRILTRQGDKAKGGARDYVVDGKMTGGFAVLAYPAEYRNSGIMTFIVGTDGVVYQRDLGENTATLAQAMTEYSPADGWNPAI